MPDAVTTGAGNQPDLTQALSGIRDTFKQSLDSALAPIIAKQSALEAQLAEAVKPVSKASQLFGGGAPAIRQGEDSMGSRGYAFGRLLFGLATGDWTNAKNEQEVHNKLYQAYGGDVGRGAILAPLGGAHLQCKDQNLAREVAQMVRQGVSGFDPNEMLAVMRQHFGGVMQAQSTLSDPYGGYLLGPVEQGEMIDLLRNKEIFSRAGAREITLPPNGRIQFPRHKTAGAGYWVGEAQPTTASDMTFGMLTMAAKKLAALVDMPNEMLRFVTPSIEAFIRVEIAKTLALTADSAMFNAVGSNLVPKGLVNYSGVLSYTATTVGADGNTFQPQDVAKMVATVEDGNIDTTNFQFVMRPLMWAAISTRRGDAVTAGDQAGPFVFRTQDADQGRGTPDRLGGYTVLKTAQVPKNRSKGASSNLTQIVGGVFDEWLIGRSGVLEFAIDPYAGTNGNNFKNDLTTIRAIQFMDAVPRREEAFINCDSLLMQ